MKIFKRKQKIVSQDPITYLNKKNDYHFFFYSHWGKKSFFQKNKSIIKRVSLVVLPVLAIALGTTLGIIANNNNDEEQLVNEIIIDDDVVKRRVYLISDDYYTVPLTISLDKKNSVYEEMLDVINLLKISSKASNEFVHGFIVEDVKVNSFYNVDNNLTIDFSSQFFQNDGISENKKIEALSASILQFENIDSLSITINGDEYKSNLNDTRLNNLFEKSSLIEEKELVTVFYQRKYDDSQYLIPISLYAEVGKTDNITFVNGLFKDLPSKMMLENLELYKDISHTQIENDSFSLTVNSSALIDEDTVNKDLYDIVLLSLDLMKKEEKVSFDIEGQTLMVEGVYQEEDIEVSSIYYNEIQI